MPRAAYSSTHLPPGSSHCRRAAPPTRFTARCVPGARGYVIKAAATSDLVDAVKTIMAGSQYISPALLPSLGDDLNGKALPKSPFDKLSEREREVLRRIVAGSSSSAIAQHLSLSRKTIDTYRGRLMVKLGVPNRSALIRMVIEHELIAP